MTAFLLWFGFTILIGGWGWIVSQELSDLDRQRQAHHERKMRQIEATNERIRQSLRA